MKMFLPLLVMALSVATGCQQADQLKNESLIVSFGETGVEKVALRSHAGPLLVGHDWFALVIDGDTIRSQQLIVTGITAEKTRRTEHYQHKDLKIEVIYELQPGWKFVSKQVLIQADSHRKVHIEQCEPWSLAFAESPGQVVDLTNGQYGKIIRHDEDQTGSFFLIQNPYTRYQAEGKELSGIYQAQLDLEDLTAGYLTDRACLGLYALSGTTLRHDLLPEWDYVPNPDEFVREGIQLDYAEIRAVTDCAAAFLMVEPAQANKVHIGWCENDYQIDMATAEGRKEYLRIIDQAAAVGCDHVLYTPNHSVYGPLEKNRDAWGWENLLWLGLGQQIRTGEWVPGRDTLPDDIQEMIQYAAKKGVKLMAYVYPSLPFMQDSAWTAWRTRVGLKPEHYLTVDTGLKSFQDWFVDLCVTFYEQTGISGYSFDHWWMAYEDENGLVSSKYQQWYGTRRILEELRRRCPDMIIDGRQQYHHFGTWTWLAGTYPHPMMSDEQPGSFNPFPDISTDRISADRQRYVAYRLMVRDFTPIQILPGFVTHQTQRSDANRVMRRDSYRIRDWDYLGWRYSVLSTVATAPYNLVINYLPARDTQEFAYFDQESREFFRKWFQFTDDNLDILKNIRPIMGQPMVGRCDGTAAILKDRGYVFLFNPNYKKTRATFSLDQSIGLESGDRFLVKVLYPEEKNTGHPEKGYFSYGDAVDLMLIGTSAMVLQLLPAEKNPDHPVLFNYPGSVAQEGDRLDLTQVEGLAGSSGLLSVLCSDPRGIRELRVNGQAVDFELRGPLIQSQLQFEGEFVEKAFQVSLVREDVEAGVHEFSLHIPEQIHQQLAARKLQWPVAYTEDDLIAPWTDPSRLILFINIADPFRNREDSWMDGDQERKFTVKEPMVTEEIRLLINGRSRSVISANNGVYPYEKRTFFGFYADVSDLESSKDHQLMLTLPKDLAPGQFQGLFLGNVENEMTTVLRSGRGN